MIKYMYITNRLDVACVAQKHGVDRVWIDLEVIGKEERQRGRDTVKSHHTIDDIQGIAPYLTASEMLVRVNPLYAHSEEEISSVIAAGAKIVMLPMWRFPDEVRRFVDIVGGRAKVMLLLETREAESCLAEVLAIPGVDEIHIGMNDLCMAYGLTFMFELLSNGTIERITKQIKEHGVPYGFGGIGNPESRLLPSPQEIITEHYRLGSTGCILSRSFCNYEKVDDMGLVERRFEHGMRELRMYEQSAAALGDDALEQNRRTVVAHTEIAVKERK